MPRVLLVLAVSAVALPVAAQDIIELSPRDRGERGEPARPPVVFISPSGEPFRGPGGRAAWFAQADANRDGALDAAEFVADAQRAFKLFDANGDGSISAVENTAYETTIAPEITAFPSLGGVPVRGVRPGRPGRQGAARFSMLNEAQPIRVADLDLSYRVSTAEWAATTSRRFVALDLDRDGRLTLDTMPTPPRFGPRDRNDGPSDDPPSRDRGPPPER